MKNNIASISIVIIFVSKSVILAIGWNKLLSVLHFLVAVYHQYLNKNARIRVLPWATFEL